MTAKRTRGRKSAKKSSNNSLKSIVLAFLAVILVAGLIWAINNTETSRQSDNPTIACEDLLKVVAPGNIDEQIVDYTGFTVSFNESLRIPNYVTYELTASETDGEETRMRKFLQDPNVAGCPEHKDYTNSGYDRGHMAPAADMKWSKDAMRDCFYLTNICPQNQKLNREAWQALEEKTRAWAVRDGKLIVIVGPIVSNHPQRLASGIAIPEGFFKVLLATNVEPMRAIAFIYKNQSGQKNMSQQAVSIDSVEEITGLDFFSSLPDEKETPLEKSCNFNAWNN